MTKYLNIGLGGAESWRTPVASVAALPASGSFIGEVRYVILEDALYRWNGTTWDATGGAASKLTDIPAETGGVAATAGQIGEILESTQVVTSTGIGATGVYGNATSISLTAGEWLLNGIARFSENGATLTTSFSAGFSDAANGSSLGAFDPATYNMLISSTSDLVAPVPEKRVSITSTTTWYLNTRMFYTSGAPQHGGRITARRYR